jgi:hypothetical protein
MNRLGVMVFVLPLLACSSSTARKSTIDPPDEMEETEKKDSAAPAGKMDAKPVTKDSAPTSSPDTAAEPAPPDAGPTAEDATTSSPDTGSTAGEDSGSSTPVTEEAKWSHTMCTFSQLKYPNIDKNMGVFPPGSCPPPETLARPCGGNSKLTVMTATSSAHETGYVHPPNYATDQYIMTRWSSPGNGATAWLSMDLGSEQTFKRLYLAWELAHASDYDVVASNDGMTWMPLKQVRGGNGYQDIVDVEGKARHIRINGITKGRTDTGGATYGYSLFDVTICGERP